MEEFPENRSKAPEPWQREDNWQAAAMAIAIVLVVGFVCAMIWVLVAPDDANRILRVQIAAPFGVFGVAAVTFCTVVWRGRISTRQATAQLEATEYQRLQTERLAQQLAATEEQNLADMLQKSAELIGDDERPVHVAAGLAILQSIATAPKDKFSTPAMNLLADFLQRHDWQGHHGDQIEGALAALEEGAKRGRQSTKRIAYAKQPGRTAPWVLVPGVRSVRYEGGYTTGDRLKREQLDGGTDYRFVGTLIQHGAIDARWYFSNCTFEHIEIIATSFRDQYKSHTYRHCDFSGAHIDNASEMPDLRYAGCFFDPDNPPRSDHPTGWNSVLLVGQTIAYKNRRPHHRDAS